MITRDEGRKMERPKRRFHNTKWKGERIDGKKFIIKHSNLYMEKKEKKTYIPINEERYFNLYKMRK